MHYTGLPSLPRVIEIDRSELGHGILSHHITLLSPGASPSGVRVNANHQQFFSCGDRQGVDQTTGVVIHGGCGLLSPGAVYWSFLEPNHLHKDVVLYIWDGRMEWGMSSWFISSWTRNP